MSHNDFTVPGNAWNPATVSDPSMLGEIDRKASASLNGDHGGDWAPAAPIWLGNRGVQSDTRASVGRDLLIARRGRVQLSDDIIFDPPHLRRILVPLTDAVSATDTGPVGLSFNAQFTCVEVTGQEVFAVPLTRWLFEGATLLGAVLTVRAMNLPSAQSGVPVPRFGVQRQNSAGGLAGDDASLQPFGTTLGIALTAPYPTTPAEYFNSGRPYSLRWDASQNNVVDTSAFQYSLIVVAPGSSFLPVAQIVFHSLELTFEVTNLRCP